MIEDYSFGKIRIDGKEYRKDIILFPDHVQDNWWRVEGHELNISDILTCIESMKPEVLIVGTGKHGMLKVLPETEVFCRKHSVELFVENTDDACELFNRLSKTKRVLGAFHLTC